MPRCTPIVVLFFHCFLLKGDVSGVSVNLTGELSENDTNTFKFTCAASKPPYHQFVKFDVDNWLVVTVRLYDDGDCVSSLHGKCNPDKCTCSLSGDTFTLLHQTLFSAGRIVSCSMRFRGLEGRLYMIRASIIYDGNGFVPKETIIKYLGPPPKSPGSTNDDKTEHENSDIDEKIITTEGSLMVELAIGITSVFVVFMISLVIIYLIYRRRCRGEAESRLYHYAKYSKNDGEQKGNDQNSDNNSVTINLVDVCETTNQTHVKVEKLPNINGSDKSIKAFAPISSSLIVSYEEESGLQVFGANDYKLDVELDDTPFSITNIGNNQIAMSFTDSKKIKFFQVYDDNFQLLKVLQLLFLGKLFNISYNNSHLAIQFGEGEGGRIAIINMDGEIKYVIPKHEDLFTRFGEHIIQMALLMERTQLLISSKEACCVYYFDFKGNVLRCIKVQSLVGIASPIIGIDCVLSGCDEITVYQLNEKGNEKSKFFSIEDCFHETLFFAHIHAHDVDYLYFVGKDKNIKVYKLSPEK